MSTEDVTAAGPTRMRRRGGTDELRAVEAVMTALPEVFAADLTARQRRILDYIRETVEHRGYPPTVREIGEAVGLVSPSSVAYQMGVLQKKGYLRKDPNRDPCRPAGSRLRPGARSHRRRRTHPRRAGDRGRFPASP